MYNNDLKPKMAIKANGGYATYQQRLKAKRNIQKISN